MAALLSFIWESSITQIICDLIFTRIFVVNIATVAQKLFLCWRNSTRDTWALICKEICQLLLFFGLPGNFFSLFFFAFLLLTEFLGLSKYLLLFTFFLKFLIFDQQPFLLLILTLFFFHCFSFKPLIFPSLLFGYAFSLLRSLALLPLYFT